MAKTIVRDVRDIAGSDRSALEHALGETLRDDQRLVVQVVTLSESPSAEQPVVAADAAYSQLPEWCDVFAGLSEAEISDVERTASQRLNLTRESA